MKTISLPLLVSTRTLQHLVGKSKIELEQASYEASTGRAYDLSEHLGGDTGSVHRLEKLLADADRRVASVKLLQQEAANVQKTLSSIRDVALELGAETDSAIGLEDAQRLNALETEAEAELTAIWGRLNTGFNGTYQFSGAATDTQPLGDLATFISDIETIVSGAASAAAVDTALDTYFNDTLAGAFHTTVYQGSTSAAPDRQVSEARRLGVDAKAIDAGVRNALRGLVLLAVADEAATSDIARELKADAAQTLGSAGTQIINKQSVIGATEEDAEALLIQNEAEKATYDLMLIDAVGVDQYDAASKMSLLETQLQAVYLATARMANLSLANYL